MNKLGSKDRENVLRMLCEGQSIRGICRILGTSKNTVSKLLIDTGRACAEYHDENVRNLISKRIQCNEIWSFTNAEQKNVKTSKDALAAASDTWTWTAIDEDNKLIISYLVGCRDSDYANMFFNDVALRLTAPMQMITDSHRVYLEAVDGAFGYNIDYTHLIKLYGSSPKNLMGRYPQENSTGIKESTIEGHPEEKHISTPNVERQNPTKRMHMHRFTHLENGFPKKIEKHFYAVALHFMYYNFVHMHKSLNTTPAMKAGITGKIWEMSDIIKLVEGTEIHQR